MDGLRIQPDWKTSEVRALMRKLQAPRLNRALSVAVNASARQVERQAERLIAKRTSLPLKRVKKGVWLSPRSNPNTLSATVRASPSLIPLRVFKVRETPKGVRARIMGQTKLYPGAFIRGGKFPERRELNMADNVFKRRGNKRLPIDKVPGARLSTAMTEQAIKTSLTSYGKERMVANVMRQLDRYTRSRS